MLDLYECQLSCLILECNKVFSVRLISDVRLTSGRISSSIRSGSNQYGGNGFDSVKGIEL